MEFLSGKGSIDHLGFSWKAIFAWILWYSWHSNDTLKDIIKESLPALDGNIDKDYLMFELLKAYTNPNRFDPHQIFCEINKRNVWIEELKHTGREIQEENLLLKYHNIEDRWVLWTLLTEMIYVCWHEKHEKF